MVNGVNLILAGFYNILTILFVLDMCVTVLFDGGLNFLYNLLGLIDGFLQAGMLGLDFNADLHVVFGLIDLVLNIEDYSCSLLLL